MNRPIDRPPEGSNLYAYAHSYRSEAPWKRMIAVVRDSRVDGMWVQRYEYRSDAKLATLKGMWR